uniref:Interferon a2 n=1 Tax=Scleropages formosus TaxID=113540 RepID=A0A8F8SY80_SCLFO|nr:interferon a2 [Scleropages formosus]
MSPATYCVCALFLVGAAQGVPSGCSWIERGFGSRSKELQSLIARMGGDVIRQKLPVRFPDRMYEKVQKAPMEERIAFLSEGISNIKDLFDKNLDAVTWDRTQLEHFQVVLYRQWTELRSCVRSPTKYGKRLKKHFKKLRKKVLHNMNYNLQSWELIRKAILRHLERLDLLSASIKRGKTK